MKRYPKVEKLGSIFNKRRYNNTSIYNVLLRTLVFKYNNKTYLGSLFLNCCETKKGIQLLNKAEINISSYTTIREEIHGSM